MNQGRDILNFVLPKNQSSYIKVIGVGGGGSNAVNHMFRAGIKDVDFVVCNTDAQALESSPVPAKIQLGKGLGAGNVPEVARNAAIEKHDEIKEAIQDAKMLFVTAGMGGGTGTGAAPVVASIAKEIDLVGDEVTKILTVAIVTTPFSFEGRKRQEQAKAGIAELRKTVDAILVINNDKLKEFGKMTLVEAFAMADDVLTTAAKGISEIITVKSYVQIDFKDVNTVMHNSGVALMGFGSAEGENRAETAALMAMDSPLLNDNSIEGAKNMLLYFGYGPDCPLIMDEIDIITSSILQRAGNGVDLIWGAGEDDSLGRSLNITLIATGFNEKKALGEREITVMTLGEEEQKEKKEDSASSEKENASGTASLKTETPLAEPVRRRVVAVLDDSDGIPEFKEEKESGTLAGIGMQTVVNEIPEAAKEVVGDVVKEVAGEAAKGATAFDLDSQIDSWFTELSPIFRTDAAPAGNPVAPAVSSVPESSHGSNTVPSRSPETDSSAEGNFGEPVVVRMDVGRNLASAEIDLRTEETSGDLPAQAVEASRIREAGTPVPVSAPAGTEVAVESRKKETESKPAFGMMVRERFAINHERMERMRQISARIKMPDELHRIEQEPAFIRQGIHVEFTDTASVSEASRHVIGKDGGVALNDPPFLSDKAD